MSPSRSQSDILLVSIAVFILFAISSFRADPAGGSEPAFGTGRADTAYAVEVDWRE